MDENCYGILLSLQIPSCRYGSSSPSPDPELLQIPFPVPGPDPKKLFIPGDIKPAAGALGVTTAVLISVVMVPSTPIFIMLVFSAGEIPSRFPSIVIVVKP